MKTEEPLKIAFFVTEFPALSETFISNQMIQLQQQGHLVHVFSESRPSLSVVHQSVKDAGFIERTFYADVIPKSRIKKIIALSKKLVANIFNLSITTLSKAAFNNESKLSVYDLIPFLDKPEYDIVHAHFGVNGNYVTQLRKLGLFKSAKFITSFHGYDLNEVFSRNNFYKDLFESCHSFTANTMYSKTMLEDLGCENEKIHLLPEGLDIEKFPESIISKKTAEEINILNIVFVGRLIEFKAPDLVIKIGKILKEKQSLSFKINIVGHGDMMAILESMIKENKLEENIILSGPRTQEEIFTILMESDVFLFPGITWQKRAENQGLVIQEAQAMRLPVIVSDAGGMKEGMIDGVTGFVLPEKDINGFVEKIELLANDPGLKKRMGEAGRKFVAENFDINILNERLMQIYLN